MQLTKAVYRWSICALMTIVIMIMVSICVRGQQPAQSITLSWNPYPQNLVTVDLCFQVNVASNILGPYTYLTNTPQAGTNLIPKTYQQISLTPGSWFFTVQASNWWGLGSNSNVAFSPPSPLPITNLTISRP